MAIQNFLYKREIEIPNKDFIRIQVPTVGQVIDNEESYYHLVQLLTAMPIDMMVDLDQAGIDWTEITDYQLFLNLFGEFREMDTSLVFGDLDLKLFQYAEDVDTGRPILLDVANDRKITQSDYRSIAYILRKIHGFKKDTRKPANAEGKRYMLERAKEKRKRHRGRTVDSQLEELIVAMVNSEQYHYGFEGTRELSIYQFNQCVQQVVKKNNYNNRMIGVYAGTVNAKELSQSELNWLSNK